MHLRTCCPHGSTQTWTVTSDAAALGGTASQTAASGGRHNSAAAGGLNVPPQAARSERSERPAAATAAKKGGLRDKMHVLLSRPAGRCGCWSGRSGAKRQRHGGSVPCEPPSGCWSGANRPPAKAAAAVAGLRHSPISRRNRRQANVTKQAFCYADRNRRRIKSKKPTGGGCIGGDYDNPPNTFRVPRFQESQKSRSSSRKSAAKNTEQGFQEEKPVPRFP